MKKIIGLVFVLAIITSCAPRQQIVGEPSDTLKALVEDKLFEIKPQWAVPQLTATWSRLNSAAFRTANGVGAQVNIAGHTSYFRYRNDSVIASLPFFGERHFGSLTNKVDQGINFEGVPEDLSISQEGSTYKIFFKIHDSNAKREKYDVYIRLNSRLATVIDINSTHRSSMRYEGKIQAED